VPGSRSRNWAQLALDLERQSQSLPTVITNPEGLVAALADLLLEALGVERVMTKGGGDEHQDHA
jgi:hypothetical protein